MPLPKIHKHFVIKESDVTVISESELFIKIAKETLLRERLIIEETIRKYPEFQKSFDPYFTKDPPEVIKRMEDAAEICDVGPMAAVAGVLADLMSENMKKNAAKIAVVENGGEIMVNSLEDINIALYSMTTALKAQIGFVFKGEDEKIGIGTSSGTFGHGISLGKADTVTVFAIDAGIGDAAATRVANEVNGEDIEKSIGKALEVADSLEYVTGTFITRGNLVGKSGNIPELVSIQGDYEKQIKASKLDEFFFENYKNF